MATRVNLRKVPMQTSAIPDDIPEGFEPWLALLASGNFAVSDLALEQLEAIPDNDRASLLSKFEREQDLLLWDKAVEITSLPELLRIVVRLNDAELRKKLAEKISKLQLVADREAQLLQSQREEKLALEATQKLVDEFASDDNASLKDSVEAMALLKRNQTWDYAVEQDASDGYRRYLLQFPNSPNDAAAKTRISELQKIDDQLWTTASSPQNYKLLGEYREAAIKACRQATHATAADRLLQELKQTEERLAAAATDIRGCQAYLANAPLKTESKAIQERLDDLQKVQREQLAVKVRDEELAAYRLAVEKDHFLYWVQFLQKYPDGEKAANARKMLRAKCDFNFVEGKDCVVKVEGMPEFKMIWCPPGGFRFQYAPDDVSLTSEAVTFDRGFWTAERMTSDRIADSLSFPNASSANDTAAKGFCPEEWLKRNQILHAVVSAVSPCSSRLPNEREWEYMCKANVAAYFPWGDSTPNELNSTVNQCRNYASEFDGSDRDWQVSPIREYHKERVKKLLEVGYIKNVRDILMCNVADSSPSIGMRQPNCWGIHDVIGVLPELVVSDDGYCLKGAGWFKEIEKFSRFFQPNFATRGNGTELEPRLIAACFRNWMLITSNHSALSLVIDSSYSQTRNR